jgi:hypothetical protein
MSKSIQDNLSDNVTIKNMRDEMEELVLKEITVYDTQKAWSTLKYEGVWDVEPELVTHSPFQYQYYSEDTESVRSLPTHNIPYKNEEPVINFKLEVVTL